MLCLLEELLQSAAQPLIPIAQLPGYSNLANWLAINLLALVSLLQVMQFNG